MSQGPTAPTPGSEGAEPGRSLRDLAKDRRLSATALIAVAALVALAVWLVVESVGGDDSSPTAAPTQTTEPVALSANGLATRAQAGGSPIYWVGPRKGVMYELSQRSGQVHVRYLPAGVNAGDPRGLLTVATYPIENAFDVTSGIKGAKKIPVDGGGIAVLSSNRPTSAYIAYPGVDYQIELYDPNPKVVRRLATSSAVRLVPPPRTVAQVRGPEAATEEDLVALSQDLGQPVYWAGPRENTTYELTVIGNGSVYVRYLPSDAEVGSKPLALTVATYPLPDAYKATKRIASGTVTVDAPDDAYAMHTKGNPHNVYLAYPGEDVQVEVYSPLPREAPRLVRQGEIVSVG